MGTLLDHVRVLVTGGAGFIGSNLVEDLLSRDNEVVVLDNFSTGSRKNVEPFLSHPRFELIEGDIRDGACCTKAVDGVDCILHQAALGSVPRSIKNPIDSTDVNIKGFVTLLHAAVQAGVKRFVYASSSSVYGDSAELPKVEERIGQQLSPYAITKHVNELFARNFHELYGIDCVGLRYFNVFGRRQNPDGAYAAVIPKFAQTLIRHESPTINGDGQISRDFTHVDNVVQINNLAGTTTCADALNQTYNVACGAASTLNELFLGLRDCLAVLDPIIRTVEPMYGPPRQGDIPRSLASIDKAKALLGYCPSVDFRAGLVRTASWYFETLSQRGSKSVHTNFYWAGI